MECDVSFLSDIITQSNEVNQQHDFSTMYSALMLPSLSQRTTTTRGPEVSFMVQAPGSIRSALVVTADENICCKELCAKMAPIIDRGTLIVPSSLNAVASILNVMVECVDFSLYIPLFQ